MLARSGFIKRLNPVFAFWYKIFLILTVVFFFNLRNQANIKWQFNPVMCVGNDGSNDANPERNWWNVKNSKQNLIKYEMFELDYFL